MKKLVIFTITFSLFQTFTVSAYAEPKLGAVCKREGELAHMPTGLLICAKVGKSLKYVKGDPNAQPAPTATQPDLKVDPIVAKIYSNYDHASCASKHPNFVASYLTSPTYNPSMLSKQKILFEKAMSCYNNYFDHPVPINIALLTEADYEYLTAQKLGEKPTFDAIQLRWAKFMMDRIASGTGRFAGSAGWNIDTDSAWVLIIDSSKSSDPDVHGAAHEFVHILQSYSRSKNNFVHYGDGATDADYVNLPNWFWEGTAELFSYESISPTPGYFSAYMTTARSQANNSPSLKKIGSNSDLVTKLKLLEAPSDSQANMMMYALGSVECEYILLKYGYSKYWKLMQGAGSYVDFDTNLQKTLGVTKADLYSQSAAFVLSQWKLSQF